MFSTSWSGVVEIVSNNLPQGSIRISVKIISYSSYFCLFTIKQCPIHVVIVKCTCVCGHSLVIKFPVYSIRKSSEIAKESIGINRCIRLH